MNNNDDTIAIMQPVTDNVETIRSLNRLLVIYQVNSKIITTEDSLKKLYDDRPALVPDTDRTSESTTTMIMKDDTDRINTDNNGGNVQLEIMIILTTTTAKTT